MSTIRTRRRSFRLTASTIAGAISGACLFQGWAPDNCITIRPKGHTTRSTVSASTAAARLIDPYSKALAGRFLAADDGIIRPPKSVVIDDLFDWQGDRHIKRSLAETVIYELHVRGFTQDPSSGVENPGTYLGVIEKIPYLKSLGVTAVELMPVHEYPTESPFGQTLDRPNYWGYDPLAFFAPHRGYAVGSEPGSQVNEFKEMVRALHEAGIEVILDVVFNHTAEGNDRGPTLSCKGLENRVYYMLGNCGSWYRNYTGCGNTINGNHPVVREMIFLCLRHWVHNYHIDGFRFDLASILSRDRTGEIVPNPPMVELIAEDPLLADTKVIAEAWDAAGAYQVGSFASMRWAEWNGRYRDDVRRYWRGDIGQRGHLATRLAGSADLVSAGRTAAVPQHQLYHVARRIHAERSGQLLVQAQRRQRRREPRRRQQQLQRQLRRRRSDASAGRRGHAPAADQELSGDAAFEPGCADDAGRRRVPAHAARQQQRLLPGQRHLVVQLEAAREESGAVPVCAGFDHTSARPIRRSAASTSSRAFRIGRVCCRT